MSFRVKLAKCRGMCAGVERAITTVELALKNHPDLPVYVLHEVVHNRHVVSELRNKGAHFVDNLEDVPENSILIFSAHGVGFETQNQAAQRKLVVIDATCPVVLGIHHKMIYASKHGMDAVVIGHAGHQEVIGTIGQYQGDRSRVHIILTPEDVDGLSIDGSNAFFATQTTLSVDETKFTVDALKTKYPEIRGPRFDDTCKATQIRQDAVKELARQCDLVLIAGSINSSNSTRLKEIALNLGKKAFLIDDFSQIEKKWLDDVKCVGVSAGASAPEYIVSDIIKFLKTQGGEDISEIGVEMQEKSFPLPKDPSLQT